MLFHKALIDEENDMSRINQYLDMVKKTSEGEHLIVTNPFDRSIHLAFDLVLNQHLNPWDIDLVGFSSMYLKKAKEERIDLMTAGRIIYMAWKVLRMQSDDLVVNMESKEDEEEIDFGWGDIPTGAWLKSDDGYSYTNLVMKSPTSPLEEPIRRDSKRKITLIELLGAFDKARKDVEEFQLVDKLRREERRRLAEKARKKMNGVAHEDHLEEDIALVWEKICHFPKKSMSLSSICEKTDPEELIKTFLSVLFLAYDKKIRIYQRKFPYGEIYIKTIGYT
ncbi:MAG: segregation/condensation protein A [Thermoplasmatales archaeon]|nr:MAG: segregation/condensation protein A [Thermoplasmatales archaeon]